MRYIHLKSPDQFLEIKLKNAELPILKVIGAKYIEQWLNKHPKRILELVKEVYLAHSQGRTVNPDSYFLRIPNSDTDRFIALPAVLEDEHPIVGIKWIASFPHNVVQGIDRASALLILNDRRTGYPLACMEGSAISATRTAASAVLGAHYLHITPGHIQQLAIIGCGPIAYRTLTLLVQLGWRIGGLMLCDTVPERAELFRKKCSRLDVPCRLAHLTETIQSSDMLIFATSAVCPTITQVEWFKHAPTVLHMSLRDLSPEIILAGQNVADDVEHCLKANTSLDLASKNAGHSRFIDGDIADAITGRIVPDPMRTRIFSPFGMGILDLATADHRSILEMPDFFPTPFQQEHITHY
jgi:ornithine cyclodeaminase